MAKKLYYKIGEACKILEIQPYVLRYWETEFPFLSPNKSKSGQRVYSDNELDVIRRIKELLYEEGYTIAGAKKKLEGELAGEAIGEAAGETGAPAKKRGKKAAAGRASASGGEAEAGAAASLPLDTGAEEEVEKFRLGVEVALRQAREILETLQSGPS